MTSRGHISKAQRIEALNMARAEVSRQELLAAIPEDMH
jgi:hypothetical protein